LAKVLGSIDPEVVEGLARSLAETAALIQAKAAEPPSFWALVKQAGSSNARRGLFLANSLAEALGRNWPRR
jgi:hypothetical protein